VVPTEPSGRPWNSALRGTRAFANLAPGS